MYIRRPPTAESRLRREYLLIKRDPFPYVTAEPLPENILEWHFVLKGPEDTHYHGGYYHGVLKFPTEFPFKPPSIIMITPNGRFAPNRRICLSITDMSQTAWDPTWGVGTILSGLLSFMIGNEQTKDVVNTSTITKKLYAVKSIEFNLKDAKFRKLFPEVSEELEHLRRNPLPIPDEVAPLIKARNNKNNFYKENWHIMDAIVIVISITVLFVAVVTIFPIES